MQTKQYTQLTIDLFKIFGVNQLHQQLYQRGISVVDTPSKSVCFVFTTWDCTLDCTTNIHSKISYERQNKHELSFKCNIEILENMQDLFSCKLYINFMCGDSLAWPDPWIGPHACVDQHVLCTCDPIQVSGHTRLYKNWEQLTVWT